MLRKRRYFPTLLRILRTPHILSKVVLFVKIPSSDDGVCSLSAAQQRISANHLKRRRPERDKMDVKKDAHANSSLESDLREAWAAKGFELAYQPQVDLRTQRVTGFEALLRWQHPVRGNVPPNDFIPLAEQIGLIDEIGQWVLERACYDAVAWPTEVSVAVNVSPLQLKKSDLAARVAAVLSKSGLSPSRLELEITESVALPDDAASLGILNTLRQSGVGIVMDDFDIGYSALGYMIKFPFSKIKIDRSFIDKVSKDKRRHQTAITIVRSVIELCKKLNIVCSAEGVETEEQLAMLVAAD